MNTENRTTTLRNDLEKPAAYNLTNKVFIVEPVFKQESRESLADVLIQLMKAEISDNI